MDAPPNLDSRAREHEPARGTEDHNKAIESKTMEQRQQQQSTEVMDSGKRFFIIDAHELTNEILGTQHQSGENASTFYARTLNEEQIEVWLYRGFERMDASARTLDPDKADVFLIGHYGHWASRLGTDFAAYAESLSKRIHNSSKPHLMLCPSWNPGRSRSAGISKVMEKLKEDGVNVYATGIERNPHWQSVPANKIVPVPYLVKPSDPITDIHHRAKHERVENSVFYAGDTRPNAIKWAGCDRGMIEPLIGKPKMEVNLFHKGKGRLKQDDYNRFMETSDYCLILCGDTPTSRSLASAVVHGCIPIRIGSRLRGLCEKPCKKGFGWAPTGVENPHLPFSERIDWSEFPEVNEAEFAADPMATLEKMFTVYPPERKTKLRETMLRVSEGFIYGWGDPTSSNEFGKVSEYAWHSFLKMLDANSS